MEVDLELLRTHLAELARVPRPAESKRLAELQTYVTLTLEGSGWCVSPHAFTAESDYRSHLNGINLVAHHTDHPVTDGPRFCIGAHLDSLPDSPGADDNASAVATLLEIARILPTCWPESSRFQLELVAFDLEEHGMLGGAEHARVCRAAGIDLRGMVSLEMLGYCDHARHSQTLPRALTGLYPDTGDFIAVIGNQVSGPLIEAFRSGLEVVQGLPVELLTVPENGLLLQATRLSDHSPFWDAGYPALMITDTSFMRNPHYHTAQDTVDTLDFEFLHQVAQGCVHAVRRIVEKGF